MNQVDVGEAALALNLSKDVVWRRGFVRQKMRGWCRHKLEPTSPSNLSILKLLLLILSWGDEGKQTRQLAMEYITSKKYWAAILCNVNSVLVRRRLHFRRNSFPVGLRLLRFQKEVRKCVQTFTGLVLPHISFIRRFEEMNASLRLTSHQVAFSSHHGCYLIHPPTPGLVSTDPRHVLGLPFLDLIDFQRRSFN